MNLFLALFHGEQALVALVFGGFIVVITVPVIFYTWLRHTKSSERKLTTIYVVSTAVLCALSALTMRYELSLFALTVATAAFILTLPWNAITLIAITLAAPNSDISDREILVTMVLGGGVNAMILFYLAKKAKKSWKV